MPVDGLWKPVFYGLIEASHMVLKLIRVTNHQEFKKMSKRECFVAACIAVTILCRIGSFYIRSNAPTPNGYVELYEQMQSEKAAEELAWQLRYGGSSGTPAAQMQTVEFRADSN